MRPIVDSVSKWRLLIFKFDSVALGWIEKQQTVVERRNEHTVLITGANPTTAILAPWCTPPHPTPPHLHCGLAILLQGTADGPTTLRGHPRRDGYAESDSISIKSLAN